MPELTTLLERCRRGDELAWEALVRQFQGRIYSLAVHYLNEREDARDAAQEIFVKVYRGLGASGDAPFVPWLLKLARNHCIDRLRRRRTAPPAHDLEIDAGTPLVDRGPDPEACYADAARQRLVWRALAELGPASREILVLKEIQGLGFVEIAELLGVPVGTVKSRSNRARLELARRILAFAPPSQGTRPAEPAAPHCVSD